MKPFETYQVTVYIDGHAYARPSYVRPSTALRDAADWIDAYAPSGARVAISIAHSRGTSCPVHGRAMICPSCVGAKGGRRGGKATTPKKQAAARKNGALAGARAVDRDAGGVSTPPVLQSDQE